MKAGLFLYVLTETESALVMETMMPYLLILLPETTISVLFRLLVIEISAFIVWIKMLFPCIDVVKVEWDTCFISYRYVNVRLRGVFSLIYFMTSITGRKRTDTLGDVSGAVVAAFPNFQISDY